MSEAEIIYRLTEHLKRKKTDNGYLCRTDKAFCINYVKDFLGFNTVQAKEFLRKNVPAIAGLI